MYSPMYSPLTPSTMAVLRVRPSADSRRISFFGLRPVVQIAAGNFSAAEVNFFGALTDGLLEVLQRIWPGLGVESGVHEFSFRRSCLASRPPDNSIGLNAGWVMASHRQKDVGASESGNRGDQGPGNGPETRIQGTTCGTLVIANHEAKRPFTRSGISRDPKRASHGSRRSLPQLARAYSRGRTRS